MPRLNPESTEKDINALIAEANKQWVVATADSEKMYHHGGGAYLEQLKERLALNQPSKPTGKKILRSNLAKEVNKQWEAWKEAVGTEEPTPFKKGERKALAWANERFNLGIEDLAKASAMREDVK